MTKADERKALEQIRKIVEGLGEDSYVGTAFEGCFEIAEQNIDNDWACSMKQRAEGAEKKAIKLELDNRDLRLSIERHNKEYSRMKSALELEVMNLKKQIFCSDDLIDFRQLIANEISKCEEDIKHAAERIVELSDTPNDIAFGHAVKIHRNTKQRKEYIENIAARLQRVIEIRNA